MIINVSENRAWPRPAANALKSGRYYIISFNNLLADQGKCITFVQNEMIMSKVDKYVALIPRIQSVLSGETDEIARMSNMAALLHFEFGFSLKDFFKRRIIR